jgi:L-ascorbate metabolism protein UlaG (beta-lactamase superfamily)
MAGARQGHHVVRPAQRDADGRFLNPDGSAAGQPLRQVWKMMREGGGTAWPQRVLDPPQPPPPGAAPPGAAAFTFIGHSSFRVALDDGTVILTDPIFSERCSPLSFFGPKRVRPPALALDALTRVDAVLVSHAHYDHMDLPSLRALHARFAPRIVTGLGNAAWLARKGLPDAVELDWGGRAELPGGHVATFLPMRHFAARGIRDRARTLWGGFAVEAASGGRFLFAGDTAAGPHLDEIGAAHGPFDIGLIPIGAYEPEWFMQAVHITPEQAVEAQRALRVRTAIAMHFATFKLTREGIDEPARRLRATRAAQDFRVPAFGETLVLPLRRSS